MKLIVMFFTLFLINFAFADEGGTHTPNFCSASNEKVCAHLRFDTLPTSQVANEFVLHVFSVNDTAVENVKVKLWMDMGHGHGHGSAPVSIENLDELNHFLIGNAWFVMNGNWQVIISFTDAGVAQNIIIPIEIKN